MTQQDVADLLGVSYQSIWTWESGRHELSREHLQNLLKLYGLSERDLDSGNALGTGEPSEQADRIALGQKMAKLREEANVSQHYVAGQMSGMNSFA